MKWNIPKGWKFALYNNDHFGGEEVSLEGNGELQEISDLHGVPYKFGDKCSSVRWMESKLYLLMEHSKVENIDQAWVIVFDGKNFQGRAIPFTYKIKEVDDLKRDRNYKFGDSISSVKWAIPPGWEFVLYNNDHFRGADVALKGSGKLQEINDLHIPPYNIGDKASSVKWRKIQ